MLPYGLFYGCFFITTTMMSAPIAIIAISKAALMGMKYRSAALGACVGCGGCGWYWFVNYEGCFC